VNHANNAVDLYTCKILDFNNILSKHIEFGGMP
jgi:hypothetical protein